MAKELSMETAQKCGAYLAACCADTNADEMKMTLENIHDNEGNILGTYKIKVTKVKD